MTSAAAVQIHQFGGSDQLTLEQIEVSDPKPNEVLVRHTAIGVNFIDVYERTGLYPIPLPSGLGREAAGVVERVGSKVRGVKPGDRVAYVFGQAGAYSQLRCVPADRLVLLPDSIADDIAAAMMLKGLTAQALVRQTYRVRAQDVVVIHAAAGGVGLLLVQWARYLGAQVVAIVGSQAKADLVRTHGAQHVVLTSDDWVGEVRKLTNGEGAHVVYDSVGRDTFMQSLAALRKRGMMVTYGNASGPVEPFAPLELARRGSLFLTRPVLFDYISTRPQLLRAAAELTQLVGRSVLSVHIGQRYALADVRQAHDDLENRRTTGSTVLLP